MSSLTTNLGLIKPDGTDLFFKREDYNSNLDIIDEAINNITTLPNVRLKAIGTTVLIPYNSGLGLYVPWTGTDYDTHGMFNISQPDRLTCKVAGKYRISASTNIDIAVTNSSYRIKTQLILTRGTNDISLNVDYDPEFNSSLYQNVSTSVQMNVNDIIRVRVSPERDYNGFMLFRGTNNTMSFCAECFELI
ncbi:hypothetical protein [Pseudobacteroides cellulosolvens]|uniref:C1q domain-containing protein n=1 Tax=Pseudobacteroides cellulosolvens ATCC 35603 = DSM 2933 TaxID=398512 RepID=A0A0L6JH17_9FIRM|nr:hypothetical protein [Pseudobacteroides cellulosolvens]KNY25014.1 hypothetical protein Bccel_0271 [Pseudobacteroides cellulosolvens ATCC 35603 = DSM 2933]